LYLCVFSALPSAVRSCAEILRSVLFGTLKLNPPLMSENTSSSNTLPKVAAVIPCYKEKDRVGAVLHKFGDRVAHIIVVDDACPEGTGAYVRENHQDPRIHVVVHDANQGVGGATMTGYAKALELGADIIVKVDGDGQMDPAKIESLIRPIVAGRADYAKGNRFYNLDGISAMPLTRLIGNLILSFASKMSSGYWKIFDPTNGFTAIHARVAQLLPVDRIAKGYFFESDILFHLGVLRAVVMDVPIEAIYGDEKSHLSIPKILLPFVWKHSGNLLRRIFYTYFLRDFSAASLELILGLILSGFGAIYGTVKWYESFLTGVPAATGVVILAALPVLVGSFLLISFINYDVQNQPEAPLQLSL
jgi:dolichol-phosphate mannosyltransferase